MEATSTQQLATEAGKWFVTRTSDNGDSFVTMKDDAPEWVRDIGEFLPDDWRYDKIKDALSWIAENEDAEDMASEFANQAVDVYYGARLAWLASNLQRPGYCNEAVNEFGYAETADIMAAIGMGQYMEASEIYSLVLRALNDSTEAL